MKTWYNILEVIWLINYLILTLCLCWFSLGLHFFFCRNTTVLAMFSTYSTYSQYFISENSSTLLCSFDLQIFYHWIPPSFSSMLVEIESVHVQLCFIFSLHNPELRMTWPLPPKVHTAFAFSAWVFYLEALTPFSLLQSSGKWDNWQNYREIIWTLHSWLNWFSNSCPGS